MRTASAKAQGWRPEGANNSRKCTVQEKENQGEEGRQGLGQIVPGLVGVGNTSVSTLSKAGAAGSFCAEDGWTLTQVFTDPSGSWEGGEVPDRSPEPESRRVGAKRGNSRSSDGCCSTCPSEDLLGASPAQSPPRLSPSVQGRRDRCWAGSVAQGHLHRTF